VGRENHLQSIVYRDLGIIGFEIRLYIHSISEVFVALTTGKGPYNCGRTMMGLT
jgi:hypothetical protein